MKKNPLVPKQPKKVAILVRKKAYIPVEKQSKLKILRKAVA